MDHARRFALAAILMIVVSGYATVNADSITGMTGRLVRGRTFAEIYSDLDSGKLDSVSGDQLIDALYGLESLSAVERDAIAEQVLLRSMESGNPAVVTSNTVALLMAFEKIEDPGLRARVLLQADHFSLHGTQRALESSADWLASRLAAGNPGGGPGTIEVEGIAVATIAPAYPSIGLAENLRIIAVYSADSRLVGAARNASRAVLEQLRSSN